MKVLVNNKILDKSYTVEDDVKFNINKMKEYTDLFEEFKSNNVIRNDSFDDDAWNVKTHVRYFPLIFDFNELSFTRKFGDSIAFKEFIIRVKVYCLYMLLGRDAGTLYQHFIMFKRACRESDFFDIKYITKFKGVYRKTKYVRSAEYTKDFLIDFFPQNLIDFKYYNMAKELSYIGNKIRSRELPSFESMFKLDEIIDDFYNNRDKVFKNIKERYFPIILWWKITSIIPLRTLELMVIPYDCVNKIETKTGIKYTITLNRSISKGGNKVSDISRHSFENSFKHHTIETSEEIYNIVNEYKKIVDYYDDIDDFFYPNTPAKKREFIFSYKSYFSTMPLGVQNGMRVKGVFPEYFLEDAFYNVYSSFFTEVICKVYGKTIVPKNQDASNSDLLHAIQPMDTRHFSIMNMVLSGIEPSIIRDLAGHKYIESTYSYSRHTKEYARNLILHMAKKISKDNLSDYMGNVDLCDDGRCRVTSSAKRYYLAKLKNKKFASQFRRVADGYCLYKEDNITPCILCAGKHERCSYYISDKSVGLFNIFQEQKNMNREMNSECETLAWILTNFNKIEQWADRYRASLSKIKSYMNKEIGFRVEYQIFEEFI